MIKPERQLHAKAAGAPKFDTVDSAGEYSLADRKLAKENQAETLRKRDSKHAPLSGS